MRDLLMSAANVGNGAFFDAKDASAFRQAMADILNQVQAVNSVFVSASLPVSVNTQGTYLNQVYMGMFRPDRNPRWLGNLKEYKILQNPVTGALFLADSKDNGTVNPATGFIKPEAQSYWTADSLFWAKKASGVGGKSDLPDGDIVEKGGAAEQLRTTFAKSQVKRNMFTCPMDSDCAKGPLSVLFDANTVVGVEAKFNVATATELQRMVNWIRGEDNKNGVPCDPLVAPCTWTSHSTESGPGFPTTIRPSIHGDVLHSRPVVLNYKSLGPHIFYGSGDGTLRGTKGGRAGTDGTELWSFVAPEFYGQFKRLRDAGPEVKFPTTVVADPANPPLPKSYFFDGAIGAYQSPDLTKAYIFATARRGGRFMYAFEVSDPAVPSLLWKISYKDTDYKELGQSWSEPRAFTVKAVSDPVIMFGAGYDTSEDTTPAGSATMGRGVYVVNAVTGKLVRFFQDSDDGYKITSPVPADVAVIDHDFDTYADRAMSATWPATSGAWTSTTRIRRSGRCTSSRSWDRTASSSSGPTS
jgi:type IV pilus assembly protein PilY1